MTRTRSASAAHLLAAGLLLVPALEAVAVAQQRTEPPTSERFASRLVASRALPRASLLAFASDPDAVNRQLAMLQFSEQDSPSAAEIDVLVRGLADPVERVRLQASAGLMRLGAAVTAPLVRALADETEIGPQQYQSKAFNGTLSVRLRISDMTFTTLMHSSAVDTRTLLQAYSARPPEPERAATPPRRRRPGEDDDRRPSYGDRLLGVLENAVIAFTPGLIDATQSPDARLATIAAERIGRFGAEAAEAVPALAAVVETHPDERAREASARALTRMGGGGAAALRRLLASTRPTARQAALVVLPIDAADAAALIVAGLRDADAGVRIIALARIERPSSSPYGRNVCDRYESSDNRSPQVAEHAPARRLIDTLPESTADRLRGLLRDPDEAVRERALGAFTTFTCVREGARTGSAEAIAPALADAAPRVRTKAVAELARLAVHGIQPPSSMLPVLLGAMRREPGDVKGSLVELVAGIEPGDADRQSVVNELLTTCLSLRGWTCSRVAENLARTPASADTAVTVVWERLRTATDDRAAYDLYMILEKLASNRPIYRQTLERIAAGSQDAMRLSAAIDLGRLGWVSPATLEILGQAAARFDGYVGLQGAAADLLAELGAEGVSRLLAVLDDPLTPRKTKSALISYVLGKAATDDARITAWLIAAAGDEQGDQEIRARALAVLGSIRDRREDVRLVLAAAIASPNPAVRREAVDAWVHARLPVDAVVLRALRDMDAAVRRNAMPLLPRNPDRATRLDSARTALADPDENVRDAAIEAVAELGTDAGGVLAAYLEQHEVTYRLLLALDRLRPLDPTLVAALGRQSQIVDARLRSQIDARLAREARVTAIDLTQLRARLDSGDPDDRESAARALVAANEDLWDANGRLMAVLMDTQVMQIMRERFGRAMDELYPPGQMLMSGGRFTLPTFPWPPPAGYSGLAVPRSLLTLGVQPTVGDVYRAIVQALNAASSGFTQGLFSAPGGFALVARMERIAPDGTPLPGRARWIKEGSPTLNLTEFLGDLFFERAGYFRVIAFVLTNSPNVGSDPGARLPQPEEGALAIPAELANMPLADQELLALVYAFERRRNAQIQPWRDGAPSPREHLQRAGIWSQFPVQ